MAHAPLLSPVGEIVRRHDPDRYFCTLFAPSDRRETLWVLYAFNHELARAREAVREPFAALIRLQWWREVVEGARRRHEVAGPLGEALDTGRLIAADLAAMIDAREAETEAVETRDAFVTYVRGNAGGVMVAAARALGMAEPEPLRDWGAAFGVTGVLRSVPALARQQRCLLPSDLIAAAGLTEALVLSNPTRPELRPIQNELSTLADNWLGRPVTVPAKAKAAALPAFLARRDLRRGCVDTPRAVTDKLAVTAAVMSRRLWGRPIRQARPSQVLRPVASDQSGEDQARAQDRHGCRLRHADRGRHVVGVEDLKHTGRSG